MAGDPFDQFSRCCKRVAVFWFRGCRNNLLWAVKRSAMNLLHNSYLHRVLYHCCYRPLGVTALVTLAALFTWLAEGAPTPQTAVTVINSHPVAKLATPPSQSPFSHPKHRFSRGQQKPPQQVLAPSPTPPLTPREDTLRTFEKIKSRSGNGGLFRFAIFLVLQAALPICLVIWLLRKLFSRSGGG